MARTYGRGSRKTKLQADRLFAELPQSPLRRPTNHPKDCDVIEVLTEKLSTVGLESEKLLPRRSPRKSASILRQVQDEVTLKSDDTASNTSSESSKPTRISTRARSKQTTSKVEVKEVNPDNLENASVVLPDPSSSVLPQDETSHPVLGWEDVCQPGDQITKIAEASYAEVYRVSNDRGVSIIKVIRLPSPIKPPTKQFINARLVDEQPHTEEDMKGELQISEWLADIPGFVVYKERYIVQGKATKQLTETHQAYQRKLKRKDPGRAQFYPSPSRYLGDTRFLVIELGDAGTALENWKLTTASQLWDIFLLVAIALARAEDMVMFEHRDLHEGNLCLREIRNPTERPAGSGGYFGFSGLDITILDYGLSRAEDLSVEFAKPVACDLENDVSFFRSTHAPQCKVYRQMRSFLLRQDRKCLPPEAHDTPNAEGVGGPISWEVWAPYTNVLWLAYLYGYLTGKFKGPAADLAEFKRETAEMWSFLDPEAPPEVPLFGCAGEVLTFAVEAGWIQECGW